jgi:hypothetical protein
VTVVQPILEITLYISTNYIRTEGEMEWVPKNSVEDGEKRE